MGDIRYLWDYHTHHHRCNHAIGTLEEYVIQALQLGLQEIGLSDHFPMHLMPNRDIVEDWAMKIEEVPNFITECTTLQQKYQDDIHIRIASEVDYCGPVFPAYQKEVDRFLKRFDYIIGSVHVLKMDDGKYYPIDGSSNPTLMRKFGISNFYQKFYQELIHMVETEYFQIVGHCDLPKKYGIQLPEEAWDALTDFLEIAAHHDIAIEINTSGFRKKIKEQYPSTKILRECVRRGIHFTLGSDAHKPKYVGDQFSKMVQVLTKIEKEEKTPVYLVKFNQKRKILVALDELY